MSDVDVSFVRVGNVRLRVATCGEGAPLMFLFGSGAAGTIDNAKPFLNRFKKDFWVACPDQRGLGESDIPPGPWTMADYALDAFGVADHLGWDRFGVIGLSFGGMVGLEMAAMDPDRIDRMVVWGASPGGEAHSFPLHEWSGLPVEERNRRFAGLMDTRLDGRWDEGEPSPEAQLVKAVLDRGGSPWSVAKDVDPHRASGLSMQLEARRGFNMLDRLDRVKCPVLIGAGTYDGLAPVHNAEVMHAGLPNSELHVYDAGHFFYLAATAFNDGFNFLKGGPDSAAVGAGGRALSAEQLAGLSS